jgi:hypothetical protein
MLAIGWDHDLSILVIPSEEVALATDEPRDLQLFSNH